jgi:glucokinase
MRVAVGVDLGGTNLRAAVVTETGEIKLSKNFRTPAHSTQAEALTVLEQAVRAVWQETGEEPEGLGLAVTGLLELEQGVVLESANVPALEGAPLGPYLSERLGMPVWLENDVRAATLGEAWFGAGRGADTMVVLLAGTGVGSGIMLGGKLWRGTTGTAGEIGPLLLVGRGLTSTWGQRGSLEALCSGPALMQTYDLLKQGLPLRGRVNSELSAHHLAQAAAEGDPLARRVIVRGGRYLGRAVAAYVNIINPELIIVGGGVTALGELFWSGLERGYREGVLPLPAAACNVVPAALGSNAGLIGAGAMVFRHRAAERFWL